MVCRVQNHLEADLPRTLGPGQHIRPAPAFGPGSQSASGLVDYSNIFVKNLDPDINSFFLEETFSQVGVFPRT